MSDPQRSRQRHETFHGELCPIPSQCLFRTTCGTSIGERATLAFSPHFKRVEKGEILWGTDSDEGTVYILVEGLIVSILLLESDGGEVPYAILAPGIVSGISELCVPVGHTYFLRALTAAKVCRVSRRAVQAVFQHNPLLCEQVITVALTNMNSAAALHSTVLSKKTVYERVRCLFGILRAMLAQAGGREIRGGADCHRQVIDLSHEEIASLVCSDRVTVTRVLSKMKHDGLVNLGYRNVTIGGFPSELFEHRIFHDLI